MTSGPWARDGRAPMRHRFTVAGERRGARRVPDVRFATLPLTTADRVRALDAATPSEAERYRRTGSDGFLLGRLLVHELLVARTGVDRPLRAVCTTCGEEHGRPVVAELGPPGPGTTGLDATRLEVPRFTASDPGVLELDSTGPHTTEPHATGPHATGLDSTDPAVAGLGVSIAHAGPLVVVAVGAGRVGIDAERADATIPRDFARNVRGWTRLEAVLKADGRGFDADPTRARIGRAAGALDGIRYALADIATVPGIVTSVAWEAPPRGARRRTGRRGGAR